MYRKQFNFRMIVSCNVLINFRAKLGCPVDAGRLDGESSKAVGCWWIVLQMLFSPPSNLLLTFSLVGRLVPGRESLILNVGQESSKRPTTDRLEK